MAAGADAKARGCRPGCGTDAARRAGLSLRTGRGRLDRRRRSLRRRLRLGAQWRRLPWSCGNLLACGSAPLRA